MYRGHAIAVVIPAYNEEQFVADVIETVPAFVDSIYPVDDCSSDGTWDRIKAAAARLNDTAQQRPVALADGGDTRRVVPIRHETNTGVGGAITTGYRRAMEDGHDVVAVMNGDGQMDPSILDRILDPVVTGQAEYAKGNRLQTRAHCAEMSRFRLVGNYILTVLTRIASGYWQLTDPQNGYTAISARALDQLDLDALYEEYGFLNDVLVRLNVHNMPIADVSMEAVYGEETSSIQFHRFVPKLSWLLLRNFLWRLGARYSAGDRTIALPYLTGIGVSIGLTTSVFVSAVGLTQQATPGRLLAVFLACLVLFLVGVVQEARQVTTLKLPNRN